MRRAQRLQFSPYETPPFTLPRMAHWTSCPTLTIAGVSKGRIPWPYCVPRSRALIVYRGLERAVRMESASAVAYWWGVSIDTVGTWRRTLGISQYNAGTVKLRRAEYDDPQPSKKMVAAKRGKPQPVSVRKKIRAGLKRYYGT